MKIMNLIHKKEDAVSPVIGVMLMLVVTIVIAAVVAAFAGGLGSDVEMAPTAALDIDVTSNGNVKITSLSGEVLSSSDITIRVGSYEAKLSDGAGTSFAPGSTATLQLKDGQGNNAEITESFVTVTVLANGKHIIAKKDVLVK